MLIVVGVIGLISAIAGVLYLFFPNALSYLNAMGREIVIDISGALEKHRLGVGVFYLIAGLFMIYMSFFFT